MLYGQPNIVCCSLCATTGVGDSRFLMVWSGMGMPRLAHSCGIGGLHTLICECATHHAGECGTHH